MTEFGDLVCSILAATIGLLPKTPEQYTLANLSVQLAERIPFVGAGIIYSTTRDISLVLTFTIGIKMFAFLPGKF